MHRNHRIKAAVMAVVTLVLVAEANAQSEPQAGFQIETPSAHEVLDAALAIAAQEQKNVLAHFGASWCTWCVHLDAMLTSDEVGDVFQANYVITHLTIQESDDKLALENPGAQAILDAAGGGNAGVPAYIFFDDRGQQLATSLAMPGGGNIGHPVTPDEIDAFLGLLEKTAPRMTAADRSRVAEYLMGQEI